MVSTDKTNIATKSYTKDLRRSRRRELDQSEQTEITNAQAREKLDRYDAPEKQKKYDRDMRKLDKLGSTSPGEVAYKLLGNKRLRRDSPGEQTRTRGVLTKRTKVLKRDSETDKIHLARFEKDGWRKFSSYKFDKDGALTAKTIRYKNGSFEEKWERDKKGDLIRTKFYDRGIFSTVSEEMSLPDQAGYRTLTRRKGSKEETFERNADGKLERIGHKDLGYSRSTVKAANRKSSETSVRALGGAFSKTYRSLLAKDGSELGRDITAHRRLLNKRSAAYDDAIGQLKSTKHTFGKLYKSSAVYDGTIKMVSAKILGIRIGTKLKDLNDQERKAQEMRVGEIARHAGVWAHGSANEPLNRAAGDPTISQNSPQSLLGIPKPQPEFPESLSVTNEDPVSAEQRNSLSSLVNTPLPSYASQSSREDEDISSELASLLNSPVPSYASKTSSAEADKDRSAEQEGETILVPRSQNRSRPPVGNRQSTAVSTAPVNKPLSRPSTETEGRSRAAASLAPNASAFESLSPKSGQSDSSSTSTSRNQSRIVTSSQKDDLQSLFGKPPEGIGNVIAPTPSRAEEDFGDPAHVRELQGMLNSKSPRSDLLNRGPTSLGR